MVEKLKWRLATRLVQPAHMHCSVYIWEKMGSFESFNPCWLPQLHICSTPLSLQKQVGYCNYRVVTLVADKLERQGL